MGRYWFVSVGLIFEWDPVKAVANIVKHGLSFSEAATAFFDPLAHIFPDEGHSLLESRDMLLRLLQQAPTGGSLGLS